MIIEYSNEIRGKAYAYRFEPFEKKAIANSLPLEVKKRIKQISKIENNPKNEGQCTYRYEIDMLASEIEILKEIIDEFSKWGVPGTAK